MGSILPPALNACFSSNRLWLCGLMAVLPASGLAVTGDTFEQEARALFQLHMDEADEDTVISLQIKTEKVGGRRSGNSLNLRDESLLGSYGLAADDVFRRLAPHLEGCELRLKRVRTSLDQRAVHEAYELYYGGFPLQPASLALHHYDNRLVMVRADLPDYRLPSEAPSDKDFLSLEALGFTSREGFTIAHKRKVITRSGGFPAPAWEVHVKEYDVPRILLIDAQTGAIIDSRLGLYDLQAKARIYKKSPLDEQLIETSLPDLKPSGYLEGRHVDVFPGKNPGERVHEPDMSFIFDPGKDGDKEAFNQVQVYYTLTRALAWFEEKMGYEPKDLHMPVYVDAQVAGNADNAMYVPPPSGPKILVGSGKSLRNLARDSDVLIHEFAHHIIHEYVQTGRGQSGVYHEGTADYFAYAINGDPYLAETVRPGSSYLRTALQPKEARYYESKQKEKGIHVLGQIWSATLWELREAIGENMDLIVYEGLNYMGPSSGFRDAFLGLLNADRDLHPRSEDDPEFGIYGSNKCRIMHAGVRRGFAVFMEELDGESCALDLPQLAQESRSREFGPEGRHFSITFAGRKCSAIEGREDSQSQLALVLLLLCPLLTVAIGAAIGNLNHATGKNS